MTSPLRPFGTVSMIDTMAATTMSRLNANAISAAWRIGNVVLTTGKRDHALQPVGRFALSAERGKDSG